MEPIGFVRKIDRAWLNCYKMAKPFQVKVSWQDQLLEGKNGDWLVEYGPGDVGVVAADVFEDSYQVQPKP